MTWHYRMTTQREGLTRSERLTVDNRGEIPNAGEATVYERHNSLGNRYYFVSDAQGIYRVGVRTDVEYGIRPDAGPQRRFVLKNPVAQGTSWTAPTHTFLLRRTMDRPGENTQRAREMPMDFTIESTDESVAVPAGRYEHCTHVRGKMTVNIYSDPSVGPQDIAVEQHEWYCPGVGLVKFSRDEPLKSKYMTGGSMRLELVSLSR
jgi:hypothetical protein